MKRNTGRHHPLSRLRRVLPPAIHPAMSVSVTLILALVLALLPAGSACAEEAPGDSFQAAIISDLHFTLNKNASDLIISGMGCAEEITDIIIEEVLDASPDVFIMTGDNTNGGGPEDVTALVSKLEKVKDAGIRLVITTGNHDFNNMTPEEYEQAYFGLIETDERDANSLSYVVNMGDVVLFAMDDNAVKPGGEGCFSRSTMDWLKDMLKKYSDRKIIFLSHHNVLLGAGSRDAANYCIQNVDLPGLLEGYGVRVVLTGHFHAQILLEEKGMYEIVSGMPLSGTHLMGKLKISNDHLSYRAESIDFDAYGASGLAASLLETEERNAQLQRKTFEAAVARSGLPEETQEQILDLIIRFLACYTEGTMAEHLTEIKNDPVCDDMIEVLWEQNYGPWMASVLADPPLPATRLEMDWPSRIR